MQTHTLTREAIELHDPEGGKGGRWLCPLPECGEHTDPRRHRSLSLVPETGLWHCHRCHAQGQLKDRWKPFERRSPKERSQEEQKRRRVGLARILAKAKGEDKQEAVSPERYRLGTLGCLQASSSALAYLEGRGFKGEETLELLSSSGVRFAPDFGRREATEEVKASRGTASVVFPLRDDKKRLVASQGRFLKPWEREGKITQKFLTLGDKDAGVFATCGALEALQKGSPVAIVEAPFDALSLALAGLPALALCGSSGVPEWLTRKAFGRRFLMAFDADQAGDVAAERLGLELSTLGGIVERLRPEGAKDWNELLQTAGAESLRALIAREDEAPIVVEERFSEEGETPAKLGNFGESGSPEESSRRTDPSFEGGRKGAKRRDSDDLEATPVGDLLYSPEVQLPLSIAWKTLQSGRMEPWKWQRSPGCTVPDIRPWLHSRAQGIQRLQEALGADEDWTSTPQGERIALELIEFARFYANGEVAEGPV